MCFFALDLKPIHKAQAAKIDYLHLRPLMTLWQQSTDVLIHYKMMKCRLAFALDILFSAEIYFLHRNPVMVIVIITQNRQHAYI